MVNNSVELFLAHVTVEGGPLAGPIGLGRAGDTDEAVEAKGAQVTVIIIQNCFLGYSPRPFPCLDASQLLLL